MEDGLTKNKYPKLALPMGVVKVPGFLYVILIVLGILILAVSGFYFYLKNNSKRVTTNSTKIAEAGIKGEAGSAATNQNTYNLKKIKKTLDWLDTQRDERGIYTTGSKCDVDSNCDIPIATNRFGFSVLWAKNRYVQKNDDGEQLEILKREIWLYGDKSMVKIINNNFWNCYFMWDIWSNPELDQSTRDSLERICFDSTYESSYGVGVVDINKMKESVNVLVSNLITEKSTIDEQLKLNLVNDEELNEDVKENQYFFNSSDRMVRYLWKKKEKDLFDGLIDFQQSLDFYKNKQNEIKAYEGCETGIASLTLFSVFNDSRYLDLSKIILDQQTKKINPNSMKDVSICGLLADKLYNQTDDESFKIKKSDIISVFLENNFDQEKGGFYSKSGNFYVKNVKYNGIMIGLLMDK